MFGRKQEAHQDRMIKFLADEVSSIRNSQAKQRQELLPRITALEGVVFGNSTRGGLLALPDMRDVLVQLVEKSGYKMRRVDPCIVRPNIELVEDNSELLYGSMPNAKKA